MNTDEDAKSKEQIKEFTSALMSAMGMAPQGQQLSQRQSSSSIFLKKLFKKNISESTRKINELRLNRLNGLFYHISNNPTDQKGTIDIVCQIILSFLSNEHISKFESSPVASITCQWIATIIQRFVEEGHITQIMPILNLLINKKKATLMSPEEFDSLIESSEYMKNLQIKKEAEHKGNQKLESTSEFLYEKNLHIQILTQLSSSHIFKGLFQHSEDKKEIIKMYLSYARQVNIFYLYRFKQIFVNSQNFTLPIISAILFALDSQFFDLESFDEISRYVFEQARSQSNGRLIYTSCIKDLKNQSRLIDIIYEVTKGNAIDELAFSFLNDKSINNYYLLYLINKSSQKIPQRYILMPFEDKQESSSKLTNRQAILTALAVVQNSPCFDSILEHFLNKGSQGEEKRMKLLKLLLFSFYKIPKSHLFTKIIKYIPVSSLDEQSNFQFLPMQGICNSNSTNLHLLDYWEIDKATKQKLQTITQMPLGNSNEIFKLKLEFHWLAGTNLKYMSDLQQLNKIFEDLHESLSPDEIVAKLKAVPESLLDIALMGINNRLQEQYNVNLNSNGDLSQWVIAVHKKQFKKINNAIDQFVVKIGQQNKGLESIIGQIFQFNVEKNTNALDSYDQKVKIQKEDLLIDEHFKIITEVKSIKRLNGLNFSEYLLNQQTQKKPFYDLIEKPKIMIVELRKLLRLTSQQPKGMAKKDAKIILADSPYYIRVCRILHFLSESQFEFANQELLSSFIKKLMAYLKPEFEFFDTLEKKASSISIQYFSIYRSIPYLLQHNFNEGIEFLAQLITSKIPVPTEDKDKKKKIKRKNQTNEITNEQEKLIFVLLENINCIFGNPSNLTSYKPVLDVISQIAKRCSRDELAKGIVDWISNIKIFHCEQKQLWEQKTLNLINLWEFINPLVMESISHAEIQRHFQILVNLLNTLYEKFRKQDNFVEIEREILKGLYIIYRLDCQKNSHNLIEEESKETIPYEQIDEILMFLHPHMPNDCHIYYCYDCSQSICNLCANFIHKIHNIIYKGSGNQTNCPHSIKKQTKYKKPYRANQMLEMDEHQFYRFSQKDQELREILMMKASNGDLPPIYRLKKDDRLSQLGLERRYEAQQLNNNNNEEEPEQEKKQENNGLIKGSEQKQYLIQKIITPEYLKVNPTFSSSDSLLIPRKSRINLVPLFNLFMRELKNSTFSAGQLSSCKRELMDDSGIKAEITIEKYSLFKSDLFKHTGMAFPSRNSGASYIESPQTTLTRNMIATSDKYMALVSGPAGLILSFQFSAVKNKFIKKQMDKKYREPQSIEPLMHSKSKITQQPILQISFCPQNKQMLAVVSQSRIVFEHYTQDNRVHKISTGDFGYAGQITKFEWVKGFKDKYYFTFLTKDLYLARLMRNHDPQRKSKIFVRNKIKDYCLFALNSTKCLIVTCVDKDGKVYRGNIDMNAHNNIDFTDKLIRFDYRPDDPVENICCFAFFVICSTKKGNIILLNFDEENNLIGSPIRITVIDKLKNHQVADEYKKIRQFTQIHEMRVLSRSQNEIFMTCMLSKDYPPNETKRLGNMAIITINFRKNKCSIVIYNDNAQTISYDFTSYNEKDHLIVCNQEEGEIWCCRFSPFKPNLSENQFKIQLNLAKNQEFAQICNQSKLLESMRFYDTSRLYTNKAHLDLTSNFKIKFDGITLKYEHQNLKQKYNFFITMVSFEISAVSKQNPTTIVVNFLDRNYEYTLNQSNNFKRQVQFPLTIKETLQVYIGDSDLEITFLDVQTKKFNLTTKHIHGLKWDEKSSIYEGFKNIAKLVEIYLKYPKQSLDHYYANQNRCSIGEHRYEEIHKFINRRKYSLSEGNLLLKLQFLRQSLNSSNLNDTSIEQILESTRKEILPNSQKSQICISIKKLLRKLNLESANAKDYEVEGLGHPNNYLTFLDIYQTFQLYQSFKLQQTFQNYEKLLKKMVLMLNCRTINCFIIMKICPEITQQIAKFYHKVITDFKNQFKTGDDGMEVSDKQRLNRLCQWVIRILSEQYQLQINTLYENNRVSGIDEEKSPEINLLNTLESIFCIQKKDTYREIDLNPFQFMKPIFSLEQKSYGKVVMNFLLLENLQISKSLPNISENKPQPQPQPVDPNPVNPVPIPHQEPMNLDRIQRLAEQVMFSQESEQEHKMDGEENRDMGEEYYMNIQKQPNMGNQGLDGLMDEQYEQLDDNNQIQIEQESKFYQLLNAGPDFVDLEQVYKYLHSKVTKEPQTINFKYEGLCENLLIQIFMRTDNFLTLDNAVFYVGLVYQLLVMVQSRLRHIFDESAVEADFEEAYVKNYVKKIIQLIDKAVTDQRFSALFMAVNSFLEISYSKENNMQTPVPNKTLLCNLFVKYYKQNNNSNLYALLSNGQHSFWSPTKTSALTPLSSVIKFQYFELENQLYQMLYVGHIYQNLKILDCPSILQIHKIKEIVLKVVVRYNLRIFKNIMLLQGWQKELPKVKVSVGFEDIEQGKQERGLKSIVEIVVSKDDQKQVETEEKNESLMDEMSNKREERICMLEELLGKTEGADQNIIEILNQYYSNS